MFGLTGAEANHGEDVKEYWWYLDAVPSHAWNRWRYHYPQAAFPYDDLVAENGRRGKLDPEYELLDTGVFDDDRYWIVEVDYAKADPTDLLMTVRVTNAGPDDRHAARAARRCGSATRGRGTSDAAEARRCAAGPGRRVVDRPPVPRRARAAGRRRHRTAPRRSPLFCENETNAARLFGVGRPRRRTRRTASTTTSWTARPP